MDARTTYDGQKTFNFYLVALDFSILGLSVDKALENPPFLADVFQVLAWICLFVSGLFALSYVEWSSKMMDSNTIAEKLYEYTNAPDIRKALEAQQEALRASLAQRWIEDHVKYSIGKYGFLLGALFLAVSRLLAH